jgi:hypothetical protein
VTLQKYFSHPSLVIYLFLATPIKLKLGLEMGGRPLIGTHLDQSNYLGNQQPVLSFAVPFCQPQHTEKLLGHDHFAEPNQHVLIFLSKFNSHGHILRTGGVELL